MQSNLPGIQTASENRLIDYIVLAEFDINEGSIVKY